MIKEVSRVFKDWFSPWRAYVAEFLGTLVFVFIASSSVLANVFYGEIGVTGIALATGLSLAVAIYATYNLSGGHLNPAVTLAIWLVQKIKGSMAIFYILAQSLGSLAAAGLVFLVFGTRSLEYSLGAPAISVDQASALIVEIILTSTLVFVVFATLVDSRGQATLGPLAVGLTVVAAIIVAGSISGAVLNPARVLGPALISKSYDSLIVHLVGPAAGSIFGLVYEFLFLRKTKK